MTKELCVAVKKLGRAADKHIPPLQKALADVRRALGRKPDAFAKLRSGLAGMAEIIGGM